MSIQSHSTNTKSSVIIQLKQPCKIFRTRPSSHHLYNVHVQLPAQFEATWDWNSKLQDGVLSIIKIKRTKPFRYFSTICYSSPFFKKASGVSQTVIFVENSWILPPPLENAIYSTRYYSRLEAIEKKVDGSWIVISRALLIFTRNDGKNEAFFSVWYHFYARIITRA